VINGEVSMPKRKSENAAAEAVQLSETELKALMDFERKMNETVIPEILKVVEERRVLASESRQRPLKTS
jgi:hypothetical protein